MPASAPRPHAQYDDGRDSLADQAATFAALASELRLEILLVLASEDDPSRSDEPPESCTRHDDLPSDCREQPPLAFSELQRRTGVRDGGRFNYHLEKLQPRFVEATEAGYRLTETGRAVATAVDDSVADRPTDLHPADAVDGC